MRFAYADPPYPGQARRHYQHPEVNHALLLAYLGEQYPDGWALSTSASGLALVLPLCPAHARVAAWVKPWAAYKVGVNPAYTWEPVIFVGGRRRTRSNATARDSLVENPTRAVGLVGAKPPAFCRWIGELLGIDPEDSIDDLFPGTGVMGRVYAPPDLQLELRP